MYLVPERRKALCALIDNIVREGYEILEAYDEGDQTLEMWAEHTKTFFNLNVTTEPDHDSFIADDFKSLLLRTRLDLFGTAISQHERKGGAFESRKSRSQPFVIQERWTAERIGQYIDAVCKCAEEKWITKVYDSIDDIVRQGRVAGLDTEMMKRWASTAKQLFVRKTVCFDRWEDDHATKDIEVVDVASVEEHRRLLGFIGELFDAIAQEASFLLLIKGYDDRLTSLPWIEQPSGVWHVHTETVHGEVYRTSVVKDEWTPKKILERVKQASRAHRRSHSPTSHTANSLSVFTPTCRRH
jgi:hypothetical protein